MDRPIFDDESLADRVGMVSGLGDVVLVHNPLTVREKVTLLEELMQFVQLWLCKDILEAFTGRVSPKGRGFVQILEQMMTMGRVACTNSMGARPESWFISL